MDFAKGQWKVVGVFDDGGTAYDSEIWGDVNQIAVDFDRQGGYASAYLRATDAIAADALRHRVSDDQRLKLDGTLTLVGAPEKPLPVAAFNLLLPRKQLAGSCIGGIAETQEMLDFCAEHGIASDIETIGIQQINEAYERLLKGDVKYRFVIDMASLKRRP